MITPTPTAVVTAPPPNWDSAHGGGGEESFPSHTDRQQVWDPHKLFALADTQNETYCPPNNGSVGCTGPCGQKAGAGTSGGRQNMSQDLGFGLASWGNMLCQWKMTTLQNFQRRKKKKYFNWTKTGFVRKFGGGVVSAFFYTKQRQVEK